jgi:TPR repeat protein
MTHDTSFLNDLVLLRNDPAVAARIEVRAREGNPHAQYAMGLILAEGRGVAIDLPRSWAWLTLAVMQGDREAEMLRNIVGIELSDEEYRAGKQLAAELGQAIGPVSLAH